LEFLSVTVYPDADAAAIRWPEQQRPIPDSTLDWINDAYSVFKANTHGPAYVSGYLYGVLQLIEHRIHAGRLTETK
jgi:hypothetical protein